MPIEEGAPPAAPVTTIDTPAAAPSGEPSATGGETVAEPVAEPAAVPEPTAAAEPAPAPAVTFEDFGWDAWDGTSEGLPEDVRGWYDKFSGRWDTERNSWEEQKTNSEGQLAQARADAESWKEIFNAYDDGKEDPRVLELTESSAAMTAELEQMRSENKQYRANMEAHLEQESETYLNWVQQNYGDQLAAVNADETEKAKVLAMFDADIQLHNALKLHAFGDAAIEKAIDLATKNVPENDILEFIEAKFQPAAPKRPRSSPAAAVVAGSNPTSSPAQVPNRKLPSDQKSRRLAAVAAAVNELG